MFTRLGSKLNEKGVARRGVPKWRNGLLEKNKLAQVRRFALVRGPCLAENSAVPLHIAKTTNVFPSLDNLGTP